MYAIRSYYVQVQFKQDTGAAEIKEKLAGLELGGIVVQSFGDEANEFLIRVQGEESELTTISKSVEGALVAAYA